MSDPYKPPDAPVLSVETHWTRSPPYWNPLAWAVVITALLAIETGWLTYAEEDIPQGTTRPWGFFFGVLLAWWIHSDRRARGLGMPFEFDAFVVFLWPIAVPYYLYRTRGWFGLLLGGGIWMLYLVPTAVSWVMYFALFE